ncbi:VOC family protein [Bradyrhizobium sp. U87765 SZCCT0131]|uniref:VOC family protein n=1 Tax=unclassified Bradyrhizobium TaxID=2631580 RepID=UPI001BA4D8E2|nr:MULTISPECIES: VOC family protein [unclassified Bradyrhizobium]MBR1219495.1 VOC family protein [Bradyrhizobium sp. U87765 SZCCT0131]MBR1262146.1 VOC family protein [Bradyrhizobium sp. U87765 SZCCT0134]MBR1308671.1 VOC family protein [Bradyrhizobium sp. U87765 SZCCT0110]MBR1317928.1 VOC family protein [Bradyrhizobium sp. U87765 SZCCT0109]MBR1351631.1 VOC family protein [Bradyrhizobium sp. U87765 SZCCT0048]
MSRFPVIALRSVDLGTPDLARSEQFYVAVWGLEVVARDNGVVYLRADGSDHHVVALHASTRPELRAVTFRVASADTFATIAASITAHGGTIVAPAAANGAPDGGTVMTARGPEGGVLRFVHGDRTHAPKPGGSDRPERLAHVNLNSTDVDASVAFYEQALGFQLSDRSKLMGFVRCNSDHHAVVIAEARVNGLNHVAFLMPSLEAVMRGSGRMIDAGFPIAWGVGRHGPGDNVFSYFIDPIGFVIEYTAEVLQVDDSYMVRRPDQWVWPPGRTDQWGIAPPKADHVKAAQVAVPYAD